ncbi:hypothetical protein [Clostridium grantii]|uniref:Uncharacterized protein n=1 Tax=Clostridium grantii DSM 8605 TaxID=1121316 RepID=A0A1M5VM31_9CLOT|nr:hypothetical protein [Clostridium grantii]SHH76299.1 hypothetical protein SAMN02745207_02351 [Clostridium grantii DSM 8605]
MKLNRVPLVILIFVILFGGIIGAKATGIWETESTKQPQKIASGEFKDMPDPEDIRGSYSFQDIENVFEIKASTLAKAFNIETDKPEEVKAKDLESIYSNLGEDIEIGTGSVKLFVALYTGLPYEGDDYILNKSVDVLKEDGKWTNEMESLLKDKIIDVNEKSTFSPQSKDDYLENEENKEVVKGKTTVSEIISWGLSQEEIENILGVKVENVNLLVKDICTANGLQFSNIKNQLNDALSK